MRLCITLQKDSLDWVNKMASTSMPYYLDLQRPDALLKFFNNVQRRVEDPWQRNVKHKSRVKAYNALVRLKMWRHLQFSCVQTAPGIFKGQPLRLMVVAPLVCIE